MIREHKQTMTKVQVLMEVPQRNEAAVGLLYQNGKVLLLKRSETAPTWPNYWCPPGGLKEPNETIIDCLKWEIKEEAGLIVTAIFILRKTIHEGGFRTWFFQVEVKSTEEITLSREHSEFMWMPIKDYDKHEITPVSKELIKQKHEKTKM